MSRSCTPGYITKGKPSEYQRHWHTHVMAPVLATARSRSHLCSSSDEYLENVINILSGLVFSLKKKNILSPADCVELVIIKVKYSRQIPHDGAHLQTIKHWYLRSWDWNGSYHQWVGAYGEKGVSRVRATISATVRKHQQVLWGFWIMEWFRLVNVLYISKLKVFECFLS